MYGVFARCPQVQLGAAARAQAAAAEQAMAAEAEVERLRRQLRRVTSVFSHQHPALAGGGTAADSGHPVEAVVSNASKANANGKAGTLPLPPTAAPAAPAGTASFAVVDRKAGLVVNALSAPSGNRAKQ